MNEEYPIKKMPIYLQGEGTYTYACRKHDCYHCDIMGLKPLPEEYFDEPVKEFTFKKSIPVSIHIKIAHKQWSGEEIGVLRDNMNKPIDVILKLLPYRSKESIYTQRHNIKKMRRSFSEI